MLPALHRYREAFERALPAAQALAASKLVPINIDLPSAIAATVGRLPGIMALRDDAATLARFDVAAFDQLETYTFAAAYAHTLYMGASKAPETIAELNERGMQLRKMLYTDAVALATRNLIRGDRIGELKANTGYKNLTFDLMALAAVLRGNWDKISGKTAIALDDLDQAERIGDQLVTAVGTSKKATASITEASVQRQRNFTLLVNAYDQCAAQSASCAGTKATPIASRPRSTPAAATVTRAASRTHRQIAPINDNQAAPSPSRQVAPQALPVASGLPGASPFDLVS